MAGVDGRGGTTTAVAETSGRVGRKGQLDGRMIAVAETRIAERGGTTTAVAETSGRVGRNGQLDSRMIAVAETRSCQEMIGRMTAVTNKRGQ